MATVHARLLLQLNIREAIGPSMDTPSNRCELISDRNAHWQENFHQTKDETKLTFLSQFRAATSACLAKGDSCLPLGTVMKRAGVRQFLTCAVHQYPAAERREMIARLKKDVHIRSAQFELLLFQLLTRSGFEVEVHPELNNGSTRRPDFLVRTPDGESMLLEAITIEPADASGLDEHAIQVLMEGLRDARNECYRVTVTLSGSTRKTPSVRSFSACRAMCAQPQHRGRGGEGQDTLRPR